MPKARTDWWAPRSDLPLSNTIEDLPTVVERPVLADRYLTQKTIVDPQQPLEPTPRQRLLPTTGSGQSR
jgi:hypothetical protein